MLFLEAVARPSRTPGPGLNRQRPRSDDIFGAAVSSERQCLRNRAAWTAGPLRVTQYRTHGPAAPRSPGLPTVPGRAWSPGDGTGGRPVPQSPVLLQPLAGGGREPRKTFRGSYRFTRADDSRGIRGPGKCPLGYLTRSRGVGLAGLEPAASSLSGKRSNRLSYRPSGLACLRLPQAGWTSQTRGEPTGPEVQRCGSAGVEPACAPDRQSSERVTWSPPTRLDDRL
ncbi:MAG: hypothetical protein QG608_3364 [Actinomycetota bacterium]|nr:hypothetical protein [Actinomycetota bacterium]